MYPKIGLLFLCFFVAVSILSAQQVPIQQYGTNTRGQVNLTVNSSTGKYYVLQVRHHPDSAFRTTTSITLGATGTTTITEPLRAYPANHYRVLEYNIANANDTDGDGLNDISEYNNMPNQGPLNLANTIPLEHGVLCLNSFSAFEAISTHENNTPWVTYLDGMQYTKFFIVDFYAPFPKIYFINSNTYALHVDFANYLGIDYLDPNVVKGQLIYHPSALADNGTLGTYSFNFSNNEAKPFSTVQRTQELIAANMPYLTNNLSYFITENNEQDYQNQQPLFQNSRVPVLFESDVYAGINYLGLNQTESYGFFRLMLPGEVPDARDIVLYESLPNSLPRVGGIITSVIQTPLSHVNLRAIHDDVPNAFIRNPLDNDTVAELLGHYIYFKAGQSGYEIREASVQEVNDWYEGIRPVEEQNPPLNLSYTSILSLDEIRFDMYDGFGAKVANLATMRSLGFPDGTIPNGYGIPFSFYQSFMAHNGFFEEIALMINDPVFISDRNVRDERLATLRTAIKQADMPSWMMEQLGAMQQAFPTGTSIRCRSSTNNEDLPGFSGAGLYDSKTQHPDEGHIAKSIKQVYASLWNLRAFEERDFYRVNHFKASMGVLCHPNFEDEWVNGVGVSADPVYDTENTFYLNSQLGEELITNPENTFPEELLLKRFPDSQQAFSVIRYSSLLPTDSLLMSVEQLELLRQYLATIHDQFAVLYHAENNASFAMDIEYKIDSTGQLVIKQARPWVSYVPMVTEVIGNTCQISLSPNPASEQVQVQCDNCALINVQLVDMNGKLVWNKMVNSTNQTEISISELATGIYLLKGNSEQSTCKTVKLVKY